MNVSQTLATQCLFLVQFKPLHPVGDQPCCLELLLLCWLGNWGSGTVSKPWCFPRAGCDNVCTLFVLDTPCAMGHLCFWPGIEPPAPALEAQSLNHWLAREVPAWLFLFSEANYFTILYWFCHILTWIHHGCTCVPHPEPPSHLHPHPIPLGHPSAPAPSTPYHASNLDWWFVSHKIFCMFQWNTWKDAQCHSLSEKCKSKPQWSTISHQSEWLRSKSLQAINAGEGVEKREPSYTVGGNANQYSHYGEQCGDSLKNWK